MRSVSTRKTQCGLRKIHHIPEDDCTFYSDYAHPGKIIRGDGEFVITSSQLGIDSRISYDSCIMPRSIEIKLNSGNIALFELVGPAYYTTCDDKLVFRYWVYTSADINYVYLHVLHAQKNEVT